MYIILLVNVSAVIQGLAVISNCVRNDVYTFRLRVRETNSRLDAPDVLFCWIYCFGL